MVSCKIHEYSYLAATIADGLHLSSGIMQPSFSPDALAVIVDSLQPRQTCIGNLDLHKVCLAIFTRSVKKNAVNFQLDR